MSRRFAKKVRKGEEDGVQIEAVAKGTKNIAIEIGD